MAPSADWPSRWPSDWQRVLQPETDKPYWKELQDFLASERLRGPVYPAADDVFSALELTPLESVRAVILGQDPYHGPDQAHGLSFSVRPPNKPPPSLRNILIELEADLGIPHPGHGSLTNWAANGVLLINTVMTVRDGEANSHRGRGWENLTDAIIDGVNAKHDPVVFLLWGAAAQKKAERLDLVRHKAILSPHPSPLSARRGFFGSRPFSRTNELLQNAGRAPIDWTLDRMD